MAHDKKEEFVLLRKRSFSEVFDDLGRFVRYHWRAFLKSFVLIPGPFLVLTSLVTFYFGTQGVTSMSFTDVSTVLSFILAILLSLASTLLMIGNVVAFLKELQEGEGEPDPYKVRQRVFQKLGPLFVTFILWLLIGVVFLLALSLVIGLITFPLAFIHPVAAPIFMFFAFLLVFPPLFHLISATFYGTLHHDLEFGNAFSKAWKTLFMAFWQNWGVTLIAIVLLMVLSFACMIPEMLFAGLYGYLTTDFLYEGSSAYIYGGLSALRFIVTQFFWSIFFVMIGLNYYSLHEIQSGEELVGNFDELTERR